MRLRVAVIISTVNDLLSHDIPLKLLYLESDRKSTGDVLVGQVTTEFTVVTERTRRIELLSKSVQG